MTRAREQFESEWKQILVNFRWCLDHMHEDDVEEIKILARTAYSQGRIDEAFHQLQVQRKGAR